MLSVLVRVNLGVFAKKTKKHPTLPELVLIQIR